MSPALALGIAAWRAAVLAAGPLAEAPPLQVAALIRQGDALIGAVEAALAEAASPLDAPSLDGHPTEVATALRALATASADAVALHDARGLLGRAVLMLRNVRA